MFESLDDIINKGIAHLEDRFIEFEDIGFSLLVSNGYYNSSYTNIGTSLDSVLYRTDLKNGYEISLKRENVTNTNDVLFSVFDLLKKIVAILSKRNDVVIRTTSYSRRNISIVLLVIPNVQSYYKDNVVMRPADDVIISLYNKIKYNKNYYDYLPPHIVNSENRYQYRSSYSFINYALNRDEQMSIGNGGMILNKYSILTNNYSTDMNITDFTKTRMYTNLLNTNLYDIKEYNLPELISTANLKLSHNDNAYCIGYIDEVVKNSDYEFEDNMFLFITKKEDVSDQGSEESLDLTSESKSDMKKMNIDGYVVYQGRNSKINDYITFEVASDDDLWFHAKGIPGAHVIIKIGNLVPDITTIEKVATIAAKNSKNNGGVVEVIYCKRKFVKKENGMKDGQVKVDYVNSETININI